MPLKKYIKWKLKSKIKTMKVKQKEWINVENDVKINS